jgi:hypothetical protein
VIEGFAWRIRSVVPLETIEVISYGITVFRGILPASLG